MALASGYGAPKPFGNPDPFMGPYTSQPAPQSYTSPADMYNRRAAQYSTPTYTTVGNADGGAGPGGANDPYFNGQTGMPVSANDQAAANDAAFRFQWGMDQLGYQNQWANNQYGYAGDDYQNALDKLNWERGGLGNQLSNAQQNLGMRDEIIANLQKMYGINDRELANKIAQSMLDQSVQSNILNQQTGLNALSGLQQGQELRSKGIAGGSMFFPGQEIGQAQISEETNRNADILANRLRGVVEGGDLTRQGLNIGKEGTDISLANQILRQRQTRLGDQSDVFNYSRMGGQYDIAQRGLENALTQKRAGIGYQQNQNRMDMIYQMLNSNDESVRARGQALMKEAVGG
jgi:hypothetical protein